MRLTTSATVYRLIPLPYSFSPRLLPHQFQRSNKTTNSLILSPIHSDKMKYFTTTAALVSAIPCIVSLTINTPTSVVQCQPELLSWTDGAPPYYVAILPGGEPSAAPLKSFDTQTGMSLTWNVDIAAGTSVTFSLKDSTGATAYTDTVAIQAGSDSSCMSGGSQAAAITPGSAGSSGNSNSAVSVNPANPSAAVTQGTDASGPTISGSTGTTRVAGAGVAATTARANASGATPAVTQSRAVATAGTTSAARPSSSSTSGAESLFTGSGLGFAGLIGLAGALFL